MWTCELHSRVAFCPVLGSTLENPPLSVVVDSSESEQVP